jgi:hypothetical protein
MHPTSPLNKNGLPKSDHAKPAPKGKTQIFNIVSNKQISKI